MSSCHITYIFFVLPLVLVFDISSSGICTTLNAFAFIASNSATIGTRKSFRLSSLTAAASEKDLVDLGMTPELKKVTEAFAAIEQEQVRYKQLLYMAQSTKEANSLPESSKIPENKVPGCLSAVYVDGTAEYDEDIGDYVINFLGDSDGLMTKGLVALLVRCLSGNTAEAIQKVDPQFIKIARIDQSLTPGRNNGFLNMLQSLKKKALTLDKAARERGSITMVTNETLLDSVTDETIMANRGVNNVESPKKNAIAESLRALKPTSLELVGDMKNDGERNDSSFELYIVAEAFDGLNLIQRQQLVYMMLGDLMSEIGSLQITSYTEEEAEQLRL